MASLPEAAMHQLTRRSFAAGALLASSSVLRADDPKPKQDDKEIQRDYPAPKFKPQFRRPQLDRIMVQDFVIFAHSELDMVKLLLEKEPRLVNATMDWGAGDWESGLGGASHMGRRDIAEFLLSKGARIDIFAATMLGYLDSVKQFLSAHPYMIDTKGPHGFTLHSHAKSGGDKAKPVLDYLQSIKYVDMTPKKPATPPKKG
jgi:hypothetical protein